MVSNQVLLQFISDGRWKAKCALWLPEELDIIRSAVNFGLMREAIAFCTEDFEAPSEQDVDWSAWEDLHHRWAFYPKTYGYVSAKCAEIRTELINSE